MAEEVLHACIIPTVCLSKHYFPMIKDGSGYLILTQIAAFLEKQGLKYGRQKVNLYYERGKIPEPGLWVDGTKYWYKSTAKKVR